jgi:hypothetical protein
VWPAAFVLSCAAWHSCEIRVVVFSVDELTKSFLGAAFAGA